MATAMAATLQEIMMTGDELRQARHGLGLSQEELADFADMSQGEVARAEARAELRPGLTARFTNALAKAKRRPDRSDFARRNIVIRQWARQAGIDKREVGDLTQLNQMLSGRGLSHVSQRTYHGCIAAMIGREWSKGFRRKVEE